MKFPHIFTASLLSAAFLLLAACEPAPIVNSNEPVQAAQPENTPQAAPDNSACAPFFELNNLDTRTPVPLQPMMAWHQKQNMNEHLVAIQRITQGLVDSDWDAIAAASRLIESSPEMEQMCNHMGAGAPGFTELALEFHRRADAIGAAARARDSAATLKATAHTLQACTTCHATFRQEVVSQQIWQERTGSAHTPPADMHMHMHHH